MKKYFLCVCLFLFCLHTNVYAKESYRERIDSLKEQMNTSNVYEVSKSFYELKMEIHTDWMHTRAKYIGVYDTLRWNEDVVNRYALFEMTLYQLNMENDIDSIQSLLILNSTYHKKEKKYEALIHEYQMYMDEIDTCQMELSLMIHHNEFKEGGEYNPSKKIQGNNQLPVYGGYLDTVESNTACLVGDYSLDSFSTSWIHPIPSGRVSAGTWSYPSGDLHLGLDVAASLYSPVYAPGNGMILYADSSFPSDCGYLGNWIGWPYGGGNTISMIVAMDQKLYSVSFAHLSNQIFVYPGQQVKQGDLIARSGNSGNSTGPHCHIEVFELNCNLEDAIAYFQKGADFSFGTGWSAPSTCSKYACRIRPERIWGSI